MQQLNLYTSFKKSPPYQRFRSDLTGLFFNVPLLFRKEVDHLNIVIYDTLSDNTFLRGSTMAIQQIDTQLAIDFIINQLNAQQQTLFEIDYLPESTIAFADVTADVVIGALVLKVFGNTAHISLLAVSPEYRGHGIGHNLVDAAIKTSKSLNLLHITVNTQDYQAPDFYQSFGFNIFGQLADTPFVGTTKYYLQMTL